MTAAPLSTAQAAVRYDPPVLHSRYDPCHWWVMTHEPDPAVPELLITSELVYQAKRGDPDALDALMARYLPRLIRWARGRLPQSARSLLETTDLVHETLLKAIEGLGRIEETRPGGFQAYVRQAIVNRITDEIRQARRRPGSTVVLESLVHAGPSPLDDAIETELFERYERAREQLTEEERLFVHLRIELGMSYEEIAAIMDRPSRDAARMAVNRALRKLAEVMRHGA
jgi:RNA polymerase sigma-70 factor, ECF subfamily